MFGWELPPQNSGGLGVACFNIAKSLAQKQNDVVFVLPKKANVVSEGFGVTFANVRVKARTVDSLLSAYMTPQRYSSVLSTIEHAEFYGNSLFEEVIRYGQEAKKIAEEENFDVIHAHDWLSFPAGMMAKKTSHKPLVVHMHATEFDRTGGTGVNQGVYDIEREGMNYADKVIAVSYMTKNTIVEKYGVPPEKVEVVYNAHEDVHIPRYGNNLRDMLQRPIVTFMGRITIQKGPDYFLYAAKKCLDYNPKILFVMAGSGDMQNAIMDKASYLGIADNFLFAGFLRGEDRDKLYQATDLYIMPSISEPFGLTALEAVQNGTPVLISKQSGVGEQLTNCLKTDFWDVDDMAAKILSVVEYRELKHCLSENSQHDLKKFSWLKSAEKLTSIYNDLVKQYA